MEVHRRSTNIVVRYSRLQKAQKRDREDSLLKVTLFLHLIFAKRHSEAVQEANNKVDQL
jgi:hypothetical protein